MIIHRHATSHDAFTALCDRATHLIADAMSKRGIARIALAGGNTPRTLHARLIRAPIDWTHVHVFWGDERCVPPTDPASNYHMACETLLDHISIPANNIYRIEGEGDPHESAKRYTEHLTQPLDLVFLGMGGDGHTASLFPGGLELESPEFMVVTQSPQPPTNRISMTLTTLNRARARLLMVFGDQKAATLHRAQHDLTLPVARLIAPEWYVDAAALSFGDSND